MPAGSEAVANTTSKSFISQAAPMAAKKPTNMAVPPSTAVERSWTRRASGSTMRSQRSLNRRSTGVVTRVTPAATAKTAR